MKKDITLKINDIMKLLPHRYPFLLIDKATFNEEEDTLVAVKNVTINEEFFNGHFPGHPVMPGVLLVEAIAQASIVFITTKDKSLDVENSIVYFMSIDKAQFRKPVVPGDSVHIHIKQLKQRGNIWKMEGVAMVDGVKVANSTFSAMVVAKTELNQ